MSTTKIFLSLGTTANKLHQQLADTVESYIKMNDMLPQTVGRTFFSSEQPLVAIKKLMHECVGSIILAYERTHLIEAVDKRNSPQETQLQGLNLPTVWNQIEATMAYTLGHPLLVIAEEGLKYEGLLEPKYDWYVMYINPEENLLTSNEFQMVFADWKRRVEAFKVQQTKEQERGETAVTKTQVPRNLLVHLRQVLDDRFDDGDLQTLCFDLDIPYENLAGGEHRLKVLNLIQMLQRTNRIDQLISIGKQIRPDVPWELTT
ncbi:MAG: hypothetical protein H6654_19195 [Ardenticatenaceae bacterium]|nr:hypothetical protein [Anaerolineales bacterium]MCB8939477.1 hypothetical protein [Ardenticatenaceae bacterium]MCB8975693.1 hypothetical protein [Ardenticatenaceae bacterium]